MSRKLVVGFDGSDASLRALDFAITRAQAQGDSLLIAHVLEWSPYSFLTPSELEERHRRRKEELQRAETSVMGPVLSRMKEAGIPFDTTMRYGHIAETL
ncbi:MAG: universal stress protein, partial [Paracoccus sp. (in: a-proteobacteria)]|nr:universal stress protein [Paracoccus sp. (in: a-proteobacteria)]